MGKGISFNKRYRVWLRDGEICWLCGRRLSFDEMTADHYIPKSKGGGNGIENLRAAHAECNQERGNKMPERTPPPLIFAQRVLTAREASCTNEAEEARRRATRKNDQAIASRPLNSLRPLLRKYADAMALRVDPVDLEG